MKKIYILNIALAFGIFVMLNFLFSTSDKKIDLTQNKTYKLDTLSKSIAASFSSPVNITVYLSQDVMPGFRILARQISSLLTEYNRASGGNIVFRIVDPSKSAKAAEEAKADGVVPTVAEVYQKDEIKAVKAYSSMVLKYKGKSQVIEVLTPTMPLEYEITSALEKLLINRKKTIAVAAGRDFYPLEQMQAAVNVLDRYDLVPVNLDTLEAYDAYDAMMVVAPKAHLDSVFFAKLDRYLFSGGNLFLGLNFVKGFVETNPPYGEALNTGFSSWLEKFGLEVKKQFVIDANCGVLPVYEDGSMQKKYIDFPFFPIIRDFSRHPSVSGVDAVVTSFVSPFILHKLDSVQSEVVAFASEYCDVVKPVVYFDFNKQWSTDDFNMAHLPVAAALQGASWKMFFFADGDFMLLPAGEKFENSGNIMLVANAMQWLTDSKDLLNLRAKALEFRPLKIVDDKTKLLLKYINLLMPLLFVLLTAVFVNVRKRSKIKKYESAA